MNQSDKEALREFARGATFVIVVMGVVAMFVALLGTHETDLTPEQKFQVVDTYRGCDVVRYTDPSNTWHYFLNCQPGKNQ